MSLISTTSTIVVRFSPHATSIAVLGVAALCFGGAACSYSDSATTCGDGHVGDIEMCDDGNTIGGDGCSADCRSDERCGNNRIDAELGELCDDGDATDAGTCSGDCRVLTSCGDLALNPGEECDTGRLDTPRCNWNCTLARCGDMYINRAAGEDCEEGGDTDTCDGDCTVAVCGDFYLNAARGEACDRGPGSPRCTVACTPSMCGDLIVNPAAGESCDAGGVETAGCDIDCTDAMCGDRYPNASAGEECDDGSETAACNGDCTAAVCGDGYINAAAGEMCDDGGETDRCDSDCTERVCGDGHVNAAAGEQCDTGGETATCNSDCTDAVCGDGHINAAAGELCDDGGASPTCTSDCSPSSCGDGTINAAAGEDCDDGGESATCDADCTASICGDGHINVAAGEDCDDGQGTAYCTEQCQTALSCGRTCSMDSECQSGRCVAGLCQAAFLATGGEHTCALLDTGQVRCWGLANEGQLGYGNTAEVGDNETPSSLADYVDVTGETGGAIVQLTAGDEHTCALLDNGEVRCWGEGRYGRLGYGNSADIGDDETPGALGATYVNVTGTSGASAIQLTAGERHTCALLDTGAVRCWGDAGDGQLGHGNGTGVDIGDDESPATADEVNVTGGLGAVAQIVAGNRHTCALLDNGAVRCWGEGSYGRLGYSSTSDVGETDEPVDAGDVPLGGAAIQLAAGYQHTCALLDNGAVRCWGHGYYGQLGYGNRRNIGDDETPAAAGDVALGGAAVQITVGERHTCALLDSGAIRCWGYGSYGQLGYGNTRWIGDDEDPVDVAPVNVVGTQTDTPVEIHAGDDHTCALLDSCRIRCWGEGSDGRLGYGNENDIGKFDTPADVGDVPYR